MFEDWEIVVIGNARKKILTTEYLQDVPHRVFYSTDYDLPEGWVKTSRYKNGSELGAYRCYRAHVDAIKSSSKDTVFVFEDDAVPTCSSKEWLATAVEAKELLTRYECVSLHGRAARKAMAPSKVFQYRSHRYLEPVRKPTWIVGMLAYFVRKKTAEKLEQRQYDGTPIDIVIPNELSYCCLTPSPFLHDRRFGSLLDDNPVL